MLHAPVHLKVVPPAPRAREKPITRITNTHFKSHGRNMTEENTDRAPNITEPSTENDAEHALTPLESENQLPSFAGETSQSPSLIGDSVKQLHGLMSDVSVVIRSKGKDRIDPQLVNAACNCAKQLGALLKLQLEWDKNQGARK